MKTIRYETITIKHILGENIVIPEYQRRGVWKKAQKTYLIETIMLQLPIPPLFLEVRRDDKHRKTLLLIDGQQRFSAINSFYNDEYEMNWSKSTVNKISDSNNNELLSMMQETKGKTFSQWDEKYQNIFLEYDLLNIQTDGKTITGNITTDRELFSRINMVSKSLNSQELRKAKYYSSNMILIYSILEIDKWNEKLIDSNILSITQVERSADVELILSLLISIEAKDIAETKSTIIDEFSNRLIDMDEEKFERELNSVISNIDYLIENVALNSYVSGRYYFEILYYLIFIRGENYQKVNEFIAWISNDENKEARIQFQPTHTRSINSKKESIMVYDTFLNKNSNE